MAKAHLGPMDRFSTIGWQEKSNVARCFDGPLSGYIGGNPKGGYWVERLAEEWCAAFCVKHAVPCNSATSGLLAACMAIGVGPGDEVWTTPYSMSATAACAKVLGANVRFIDIEDRRFGINPLLLRYNDPPPKAIIVTNLFGHPAKLNNIMAWCKYRSVWMIEDNAQAPFAIEDGIYTGTIGHIGVFSLNVHKHIQCAEGGVIVTGSYEIAKKLNMAINHGELTPDNEITNANITGLNLRMTEPIAAIACAQLAKAKDIIEGRREIALAMNDMVKDIPWIRAHEADEGCRHVYYLWTALVANGRRDRFVAALIDRGIPIRAGYAPLLNKLFGSEDKCFMAEGVDKGIIVFEVCAWGVKTRHLKQMRDIIHQEAEDIDANEPEGQRLQAQGA